MKTVYTSSSSYLIKANKQLIKTNLPIIGATAFAKKYRSLFVLLFALAAFNITKAQCPSGNIVYVDSSKVSGGNNGSSWANAFTKLQDALALADTCSNVTQIWVAKGTYYPDEGGGQMDNDTGATFLLKNNLGIYGGFVGTEDSLYKRDFKTNTTILSGDIDENNIKDEGNSLNITTGSGTNNTAVLDGFTVSGAQRSFVIRNPGGGGMFNNAGSPTVINCVFSGNSAYNGGGIFNYNSSNTIITNCTFSGDSSASGGGVANSVNSNPVITGCTFTDNFAGTGGGIYNASSSNPVITNCFFSKNSGVFGGGMYNNLSNSRISDCIFSNNSSTNGGGGIYNENSSSPSINNSNFLNNSSGGSGGGGGGMLNAYSSSPVITNCSFSNNTSGADGGGIYNIYSSSPVLTNCRFLNNSSSGGGGGMFSTSSSNARITGCTFSGNSASGSLGGGGMYNYHHASPSIVNSTFSGNSASSGNGGGIFNYDSSNATITGCIFSGNSASTGGGGMCNYAFSNAIITGCNFYGNSGGTGGGMSNFASSNAVLKNCTFSGDSASIGAGMYNYSASPLITNCTFSGNYSIYGSGILNVTSNTVITNTIIWDNKGAIAGDTTTSIYNIQSSPIITYSLVQGQKPGGTGNFDGTSPKNNPLFIMPVDTTTFPNTTGNLRLRCLSPVIDKGNNAADTTLNDLDSNQRIVNGIIDLGAYENQGNCCPSGNIVYVDSSAKGNNDGTSWATAFTTLQDALAITKNCTDSKEIWVAKGTYYPDEGYEKTDNDANATFRLKNNISIYGGFAGTEDNLNKRDFEKNITILSGDIDKDNSLNNNSYHVVTGSGTDSTAKLDGFTITGGNSGNGNGGGIYNNLGSPVISNCILSGNAGTLGGGMCNSNHSNPYIFNCAFDGNNAAAGAGGAMYNETNSSPVITNCIYSGNYAEYGGGGIENQVNSNPVITNCSFSGNATGIYGTGGGIDNLNSNPVITNCITWNNKDKSGTGTPSASIYNNNSTPNISYSLLQGQTPSGTGNLNGVANASNSNYPLFIIPVNPNNAPTNAGNLRLQCFSPAIDKGDNDADAISTDLDGNTRIANNIIDLGAYENNAACTQQTSIAITSSNNSSCYGSNVTFTSTVLINGTANTPVTAGSVTFSEGAIILEDSVALNANGQASFSTNLLSTGTHNITATYNPSAGFSADNINTLQVVNALPVTPVITVTDKCGSSILSTTSTDSLMWSTGATTSSINVSIAGRYTVTQTKDGCTSIAGSAIASPSNIATLKAETVNATTSNNNCNALVYFGDNVTVTGAPPSSLVYKTGGTTISSPYTFNLGRTNVKVIATNACGSISKTFLVIVKDGQAPFIKCRAGKTRYTAGDSYTVTGNEFDATASDNCEIPKLVYSLSGATKLAYNPANTSLAGTHLNRGVTIIEWKAVDAAGNKSFCTTKIIVKKASGLIAKNDNDNNILFASAGKINQFNVTAFPNPAPNQFTLKIQSNSNAKCSVIVVDITGRRIEELHNVSANSTIKIGGNYFPGVYVAEVMQGEDRVSLKLIKSGK